MPDGLRPLVVIPTYQEAENIATVLQRVRTALPAASVLVVDDGSPDGTADLAEAVASEVGQVEVLRRPAKAGLGSAYRAGFAHGIARGFDVLIEMDADLSHDPADLPRLVAGVESGASLAIGSRYVPGGATPNWPKPRLWLSRWGNRYVGIVLGLGVRDATAGLPCLPGRDPAGDRLRHHARRWLRVPGGDGLSGAHRGRGDHRAPHHLQRPRARHVEDVGPDRGRGHAARDVVGDPRPRAAPAASLAILSRLTSR